MAKEITFSELPGNHFYAVFKTATGQYINGITPEDFNAIHWGDYAIPISEFNTLTGQYYCDFPILNTGFYYCDIYLRQGTDPELSDTPAYFTGSYNWDREKLIVIPNQDLDINDVVIALQAALNAVSTQLSDIVSHLAIKERVILGPAQSVIPTERVVLGPSPLVSPKERVILGPIQSTVPTERVVLGPIRHKRKEK